MKTKTIIVVIVLLFLLTIIRTCSSDDTPDVNLDSTNAVAIPQLSEAEIQQQEIKAESDRILAEAQAEYDANNEVELIYTNVPSSSTIESQSQPMSFSECRKLQSKTMIEVLPYKSFIIVDTQSISTVKICTDDGAVLISCSAPDSSMVTTKTDNIAGCY